MKKLIALIATTMVLVFTTAASADLLDGLVGYWPFDGNANDLSGNGNHGSTHGVSLTSDRHGNNDSAYYFDGSSHISVSDSATLRVSTGSITIAAWIKPTKYGVNTVDGSRFVSVLQMGNDYRFQIGMGSNATKAIVYLTSATSAIEISMPSLGSWQFLALTLHSGTLKYYRNGTLVASKYTGDTISTGGGTLTIGLDPGGAPEYHIGDMEDVYIYNRALSSSEIKALYDGNLKVYTVAFNANDGTERIEEEKVIAGAKLTLPASLFRREDYVFQGWAKTANGAVEYEDGQEIDVLEDMTLYAVWARPMTLLPDSADWSSGSITLRCEDDATSASTQKYSLEYCNESGEWVAIDGAKNIPATKGQNSAGQEVWIAKLTDPGFSSRLGGIPPVSYRVTDENGRVSDSIPTRRRHGLPVGVGQYENAEGRRLTELRDAPALAREFGRVARQRGGFACREALAGSSATCRALDDALDEMAAKANPGDICLFYLNTHGGMDGTKGVFCMYDDDYFESRLVGKVEQFYEKGAAFVAVLGTCHSEALVQRSFPNVGIIAAAEAETESDDFFDKFLIRYGWDGGWAGSGETVSFGALAGYAKAQYETLYNGIVFVNEENGETTTRRAAIDNEDLLARITAGKRGTHGGASAPDAISGIAASQGTAGDRVEVSWNADSRADGYLVFGKRGGSSACLGIRFAKQAICTFRLSKYPWLADSSADRPLVFEVRAYNGAGIGSSDLAEGWIDAETTTGLPLDWLQCHPGIAEASGGDVDVAAAMTAANGKMTVAECYALGIDPDNKDDNLSIEQFEMVNGKPVITLNHTADGSGKTFLPDVRVLGTTALGEFPQWDDVTDIAAPDAAGYRFFKATVELP
ncbi:MAG: InlB B-repeat-containing protein [Kiritimatiellae bacterium]|nr:InlB B-repeat-containing protein [Kiritimatiellia bacterium]